MFENELYKLYVYTLINKAQQMFRNDINMILSKDQVMHENNRYMLMNKT